MGPIGHFSVGLAAKPAAAKIPLGVLLLARIIHEGQCGLSFVGEGWVVM